MAFGFRGLFPFEGFDDADGPAEQVVPVGGSRFVEYLNVLDKPAIRSSNPACVKVTELPSQQSPGSDRKLLQITGVAEGTATIFVSSSGCIRASLEVYCLPKRKLTLAYHLVSDGAGHATSRTAASLASLVDEINRVYLPQTNIEFSAPPAGKLEIREDLGSVVTSLSTGQIVDQCKGADGPGGEMLKYLIPRVGAGDIHIFFVWEMGAYSDTPGSLDGYTAPTTRHCIVRDNTGMFPLWFVAAHEIGHALGTAHTSRLKMMGNDMACPILPPGDPCAGGHFKDCKHWYAVHRHLMMESSNRNSPFISPKTAVEMNARLLGY